MSNTFQGGEAVPAEDMEVLESMHDGDSIEKEDADKAVTRMLAEEAASGRGKEQHEEDDDAGEEEPAAKADEDAVAKQKAKDEETRTQRRARLRRETIQRAQADRDKLQREVGRLQERLKLVEQKNPELNRDAYGDNHEAYIGDRAGYAAQHVATKQSIEDTERATKEAEAEIARANKEAMDDYFSEGNRRFPDFERTIKSDSLNFTPIMVEALMEDGLHDLAYELAKQPAEVARIAALSPTAQVKEITRAQARLEAKAAESKTTKAPPPIKPVRAAGASTAKSPSEMSMSEYAEYRKKQMAAQR